MSKPSRHFPTVNGAKYKSTSSCHKKWVRPLQEEATAKSLGMVKHGKHQLVKQRDQELPHPSTTTSDVQEQRKPLHAPTDADTTELPRKRRKPSSWSAPTARNLPKRVQLPTEAGPDPDRDDVDTSTSAQAPTKLSHCAYVETSRIRPPTSAQYSWKPGQSNQPRSMGLVRAGVSKELCPAILQGKECTNQFCTKRHDVTKQATLPVCSYFQRNGQCWKEDCPFRHVKVSESAKPCPAFTRQGYCTDANCTFKHMATNNTRGNKKTTATNNTTSISSNPRRRNTTYIRPKP